MYLWVTNDKSCISCFCWKIIFKKWPSETRKISICSICLFNYFLQRNIWSLGGLNFAKISWQGIELQKEEFDFHSTWKTTVLLVYYYIFYRIVRYPTSVPLPNNLNLGLFGIYKHQRCNNTVVTISLCIS